MGRQSRQFLVVGNWKMHGDSAGNASLLGALRSAKSELTRTIIAVCPPFVYLAQAAQQLTDSGVAYGAQNVSEYEAGAYTGEIAAAMLADVACRYVIVGHSERRVLCGESDEKIAAKFMRAQAVSITPILCVGENLVQREAEQTLAVIERQLDAVVQLAGHAALADAVIAYEPVWAIGTGRTATPDQAQKVHRFIREFVAGFDDQIAERVPILYGGSVKAANAASLFAEPDIDGALVGGAALNANEFIAICRAAEARSGGAKS